MDIHKQEILESIFDTFNRAVSTGHVEDPSVFMQRMIEAAQVYEQALLNDPFDAKDCNEDCAPDGCEDDETEEEPARKSLIVHVVRI